ncbi:MAG: DUF4397 domain-containing protein [Bacteroidetes bacterium]|nr:DUF4397 domain-containing protein [Bacteroidota bacterium]
MKQRLKFTLLTIPLLLLTIQSAQGQTTYYGSTRGTATSSCTVPADDPSTDAVEPVCTVAAAFGEATGNNDTVLIQVSRAGGSVTISDDVAVSSGVKIIGAYARGGTSAVSATLRFAGTITLSDGARLNARRSSSPSRINTTVEYSEITIVGDDASAEGRINILTTAGDVTVKGSGTLVVDSLTVNSGDILTLGDDDEPTLRVPLKKGATSSDTKGILTVNGAIEGDGNIWIAHANTIAERDTTGVKASKGATVASIHTSSEYKPSRGFVDHGDCVFIRGSGSVETDIYAVAAGNICVQLSNIGGFIAVGSLSNDVIYVSDTYTSVDGIDNGPVISTDVYFINDVEIDGDVEQWNDAQIVFERKVTIAGDVRLEDGANTLVSSDDYGTQRIVASDATGPFAERCTAYVAESARSTTVPKIDAKPFGPFAAVEFKSSDSKIEGSLSVYSDVKLDDISRRMITTRSTSPDIPHETVPITTGDDDKDDPCFAIVQFTASGNTSTESDIVYTTHIGEDLFVENEVTVEADDRAKGNTGRVHLDGNENGPPLPAGWADKYGDRYRRVHNLSFDGGGTLDAGSNSITMGEPAIDLADGQCTGTDEISLTSGNRIMLGEDGDFVIRGTLTLDALVVQDELEIEGALTVTTLKTEERGEIGDGSENLKVMKALILGGDGLSGSLNGDSELTDLVYATTDGDNVKGIKPGGKANEPFEVLSMQVRESSRLRLDQVTRTKNLGLCSGNLVLREAGAVKDSTLYVHNELIVRDGSMVKDPNRPGSVGTDYFSPAPGRSDTGGDEDGYILKYRKASNHTVGAEWFGVRNVEITNNTGIAIIYDGEAPVSIPGYLIINNGHFHVKNANLTVGEYRARGPFRWIRDAERYLSIKNFGELHTKSNDLIVHGTVTVGSQNDRAAKILTEGGNLHVLGNDSDVMSQDRISLDYDHPSLEGYYEDGTASVTVYATSMIDIGAGSLQLGPEYDARVNSQRGDWLLNRLDSPGPRPRVLLTTIRSGDNIGLVKGAVSIPKGSKRTVLRAESFDAIDFDGTKNPQRNSGYGNRNDDGTLFFAHPKVIIGSLKAENGTVEFSGASYVLKSNDPHAPYAEVRNVSNSSAEIKGDVTLNSARIFANGARQYNTRTGSPLEDPRGGNDPDDKVEDVYVRTLKFGGNLAISGTGGFSSRAGTKVTVEGNYTQEIEHTNTNWTDADNPVGGTYLSSGTTKTVKGGFKVSGTGDARRYNSANAKLNVGGDFDFGLTRAGYYLNANLTFSGKETQSVKTSAIDLNHVTIDGAGVSLASNVTQWAGNGKLPDTDNERSGQHSNGANLTLIKGVIESDSSYYWLVKKTDIEENLIRRTSARATDKTCGPDEDNPLLCSASIIRGSRQSYSSTVFARHLLEGNAGDGDIGGGYIFPVGGIDGDNSYYRPAIVQLPVDLADAQKVSASMTEIPEGAAPDWPDENLRAQGTGGNFLTLDTYAKIFWKLDAGKEELATNVNLRLAAGGIPNVFDHTRLRIVQWDCDWTNPRLAGQYDLSGGEEGSFTANDYVNGTLNLTQEGIDIGSCSIFAVAANQVENPINQPELASGRARLQFIHNAQIPAPVNVKLDGDLEVVSGATFQSATGYLHVAAGGHSVSVEIVGAPEASQPADISLGSLVNNRSYAVVAHGGGTNIAFKRLETRMKSLSDRSVDVLLVHGSADLGSVRLQTINILDDPRTATPTRLLANNFSFDQATNYIQMDPDYYRIEAISGDDKVAVFDLNLSGYQGQTLIANLSGSRATNDLDLYVVDENGSRVNADVVTGTESDITEIPTEFALHGNYPNPFNPSTRIQFDLPESAQVTVQIVDMLGREVMALPAKEFEAGANRSIELNAINLASGTYLYRMIATGAENRYVKTGRMTLVK